MSPLFGFAVANDTLTITLLSVACAGMALYLAVRWFLRKDTEIEDRRRAAIHMHTTLKNLGLVKIPGALEDYAVGDYSGLVEKLHDVAKLFLSGEQHVVEEFKAVYERVLDAKLATPEGLAYLASRVKDATALAAKAAITVAAVVA